MRSMMPHLSWSTFNDSQSIYYLFILLFMLSFNFLELIHKKFYCEESWFSMRQVPEIYTQLQFSNNEAGKLIGWH